MVSSPLESERLRTSRPPCSRSVTYMLRLMNNVRCVKRFHSGMCCRLMNQLTHSRRSGSRAATMMFEFHMPVNYLARRLLRAAPCWPLCAGSWELRQRQHVAIWVAKPSHQCAAWRRPYTVTILIHAVVMLKCNSGSTQFLHRPANVRNCPSQRRVGSCANLLNLLNAQHSVANSKHQGRRLIRHKRQAKHPLVKSSRPPGVRSRQEQNRIVETCHKLAWTGGTPPARDANRDSGTDIANAAGSSRWSDCSRKRDGIG